MASLPFNKHLSFLSKWSTDVCHITSSENFHQAQQYRSSLEINFTLLLVSINNELILQITWKVSLWCIQMTQFALTPQSQHWKPALTTVRNWVILYMDQQAVSEMGPSKLRRFQFVQDTEWTSLQTQKRRYERTIHSQAFKLQVAPSRNQYRTISLKVSSTLSWSLLCSHSSVVESPSFHFSSSMRARILHEASAP